MILKIMWRILSLNLVCKVDPEMEINYICIFSDEEWEVVWNGRFVSAFQV